MKNKDKKRNLRLNKIIINIIKSKIYIKKKFLKKLYIIFL